MIWISPNFIDNLIYCDNIHSELYPNDHKILIIFLDKNKIFNSNNRAKLRKQNITKTIYDYDKMNSQQWQIYANETDYLTNKNNIITKYKPDR